MKYGIAERKQKGFHPKGHEIDLKNVRQTISA
jgi:hypothetical protein